MMKPITLISSIFVLALVTVASPARARGIELLQPIFGNWLGGPKERIAKPAEASAMSGISSLSGGDCNFSYIVRNNQRVRYEVCEIDR